MTSISSFRTAIRVVLALSIFFSAVSLRAQERWTEERANNWWAHQPWPVGANFVPSTAINELEMWQPETYDPATIDRELGWAEAIGMNTMRVFLHNLLWEQDPKAFERRIDDFLAIAARHHIRPIFVLFDSSWEPKPKLGPQHAPIPGVHNSGWVQAPGAEVLADPAQHPRMEKYVKGVVGAFANDQRILAWDIWNEPDMRSPTVLELLPQAFAWARSARPAQPLTSGLFDSHSDWSSLSAISPLERVQIEQSDVLSFHNYEWPENFEARVRMLETFHRPILCTEYMARGAGSTFDTILPIAKSHHVGAINWGLVAGKTQTNLPWDSWKRPYVNEQPVVWHHDVFYADGKPYRQREIEIIRTLTSADSSEPQHPARKE